MRTLTRSLVCMLASCAAACSEDALPKSEHAAYQAPQQQALACVPNLDGRIDSSEVVTGIGVPANFLVSPPGQARGIDASITGDAPQSGAVWDWSADYASDRAAKITATKIDGKWYADSFPDAQFVVPFDAGDTVEAVYERDDTTLYLLGLASADESPPAGKTLLVYQTPIEATRFPIQPGTQWVSAAEVKDGTLDGLPYAGKDTYEISVDAVGELDLPDVIFTQAHRVRSRVTVEPAAGMPVVTRQVQFFVECFGEVARATAAPNDDTANFTQAAEVRRLGIPLSKGERKRVMWDVWKKSFDVWENATAQYLEHWLKSPVILGPSGAMLSAVMKAKAASDKAMADGWGRIGLPTKRDQERTLHLLNDLQSRILDLEEKLQARS